ncbi:ribosome recycling factor [Desulfitispora alkaliphila]|uniref:ribosome recycling factor n=1 Tax=Desulfitispora alkaliphila TaxID=622674 RepID=UPI003D1DEDAB
MLNEVFADQETKMNKAIEALKKEYATLRTGRANPSLLDKVTVDYYGTPTPINQMANVSAPEARLLVIQPWDKSTVPEIEKAISKSDLNLTPSSDGTVIRIAIPQLTEERRKELVKVVKKKAEDAKVAIRNIRRDANEETKMLEKEGEISEDEQRRAQDKVQEITDKFIKQIDDIAATKEKDIMEV